MENEVSFHFCFLDVKEKSAELSQVKLEKKFGTSPVFIASTLMENGGFPVNASPASLLSEAIQVISCGYEDKTEWGKEVSFGCMSFFVISLIEIHGKHGIFSAHISGELFHEAFKCFP